MKAIIYFTFFCFLSVFSFSQTKRALIVAIGNYPEPAKNRWKVISSLNDIPLIKNALVANQHFSEKNIRLLTDSQATRKGIIDALDNLVASSDKGDIVVIHFSSHGQQIEDDGNKDEVDGLDEAIVPYGAVFSQNREKFALYAAGYLRDDLFGEKITQLRNKLGKDGDLLVIIDACHSGTGTRGVETAKTRGGNIPMVSTMFNSNAKSNIDTAGVFKENSSTMLSNDAATYVVISASQASELNSECYDDNKKAVGSLSYSFSKTISSLKENITYRGLFALIENTMREKVPSQKPVLEGDGIDRKLFGGKYEKQQPYFTINLSQSKNDLVVLNAGFISGITKGSEINFYEPGTTSTTGKKPVNKGKVSSVTSFNSTVTLDSVYDGFLKMNPLAFIKELSYGESKIKLYVSDFNPLAKIIEDSLKNFQLIEFDKICDLVLDTSGSMNTWALKYPNSGSVFQDGLDFSKISTFETLKAALIRFNRFRYLQGLSFSESELSADIQLVFLVTDPIEAPGTLRKIDIAKTKSRTHFGRLELIEGDTVYLRVINTGNKKFIINIVDIQPDGFINAVIPNKHVKNKRNMPDPIKWENCVVEKSDTLFFRHIPIKISKPYGEETFKVFLFKYSSVSEPMNLEDILTSRDEVEAITTRGGVNLNGLEKIFVRSNTKQKGTRGVELTNVDTDENGTVFSFNFQILPK